MRTVDPRGLDIQTWTAATGFNLDGFGAMPVLFHVKQWQGWGAAIMSLSSLSKVMFPDPYQFDDWETWAMRFNQALDEYIP